MRRYFPTVIGVLALGASLLLPAVPGPVLAAGTLAGGWTFDAGSGS